MIAEMLSLFVRIVVAIVLQPAAFYLQKMGIHWNIQIEDRNGEPKMPRSSNPVPAHPVEPKPPTELEEIRAKVHTALTQMRSLLKAIRAPLPTGTGDGTVLKPEKNTSIPYKIRTILTDLNKLGFNTIEKVAEMGIKAKTGEPIDDRTYLMESAIQAAASLPSDMVGTGITNNLLTALWDDLQHPPQDFMEDKYKYRSADGSDNSYLHKDLGKANKAYARTVKPVTVQSGELPDPGVLFDTLMAREQAEEHPNKISSILFYLASIIIHDLFRTDHKDFRVSKTSSYLDLSPLYGSDYAEQKRMRTFADGKIYPDCFSETRLLSFPPGVGTLLIMFNRFHNYVVEQLVLINEGNRFTKPTERKQGDQENDDAWHKYDNDLFQTGRLITCGLYINIILVDYVRTILNLNRTDENWQLNPRAEINGTPLGTGNQVSAEFNLVYRWHAAVSDRDDKWTRDLFHELFEGRDPEDVPQAEFLKKLGHLQRDAEEKNPQDRDFAHLKRLPNGKFDDNALATILIDSIEDCANKFGPRQVPAVFRQVEILGIRQARAWNLATLNEFRQHFDLKPYRKFSEITNNKEVSDMLERLYDTPDHVELYPGLVVEDPKEPMVPGAGLCPSFTTSRAVLSDAVALVRGDRFYTTSYNAKLLTNWGFTEQNFDVNVDNGCVFYKLILRAFPNHFEPNSVYAHYPMTVPEEMKQVLTILKKDKKYTFERPGTIPPPQMVFSYAAATQITADQKTFKVTWGKAMEFLMGPPARNFMLSGDEKANADSRKLMEQAMYLGPLSREIPTGNETWLKEVKKFYEDITPKLLKKKSYKLGKVNQVDIIRDVGNMAHVHFCAEMFALPLKTEDNPHGIFTEHELYLIMASVFICVFFDVDPSHSFPLRQAAHEATQLLGRLLQIEVTAIKLTGNFADFVKRLAHPSQSALRDYGLHMIHRLLSSGMNVKDLVWGNIMGTAGGMVANQGQLLGQVLDFLFQDQNKQYREILHELAREDTPAADDKIMRYFLEISRLNGETGVTRDVSKATTVHDGKRTLELKAGDRVFVNLKAASHDPIAFPKPKKIVLDRPIDSYIHLGHGPHQCLGLPMVRVGMTAMLKAIFKLDGLEAAPVWPGPISQVKKIPQPFGDDDKLPESWHYHAFMTEDWDSFFPFPTSLKIQFNDTPGAL